MAENPRKRRRSALSTSVKKSICLEKEAKPKQSQEDLVRFVKAKFSIDVGRSTISDVLKGKEKWIAADDSSQTKERTPKHQKLEDALYIWFCQASKANLPLSEQILITQARALGSLLGVTEFSYSRGWLQGFKTRHGLSSVRVHGEAGDADPAVVNEGRDSLREVLSSYSLEDIFNMDETGLFYRLEPDRTLATRAVKGRKKSKDRITVALCCNATGTEKLTPLVIGKSKRPRCFPAHFDVQQIVDYCNNAKAWMTSLLFSEWIQKFDQLMARQKRKVILLLDNASSHTHHKQLKSVVLHYLPPKTTAHLQPLDAGIIRNFKLKYQQHLVQCYVDEFNSTGSFTLINLKQAIYFVKDAWSEVSSSTISNCFKHTGIVREETAEEETREKDNDLSRLGLLIDELAPALQSTMAPEDYLCNSPPAEEFLTDEQIISLVESEVIDADERIQSPKSPDDVESEPVSVSVAIDAAAYLLSFIEQSEHFSEKDYCPVRRILTKVKEVARAEKSRSLQQTTIQDFFE